MLSSLFHVHKSCNLVQSNVDSVSHLLPNSFSRCPRTSFINAEVIVVDDTFVVPPPEVGHSVISPFSSFRVLSVDRIIGDFSKRSDGRFCFCQVLSPLHTSLCLFLYTESSVTRTGFEAQNLTTLLTIFGAMTWLDIGEARACTLRKTRFLRNINPTTFRCTLIETRRLGSIHIPLLLPRAAADLSITRLKCRREKLKLLVRSSVVGIDVEPTVFAD
jgi:hypothetical protein